MFTPGSPGLRGRPNRAPNWPDQVLPNRPLIPTDSPKRAAPAHIRTFTGMHAMIRFTSVNMLIHFLHMEPSNTQTYYTDFTNILAGLHQDIHINTIYRLMLNTSSPHECSIDSHACVSSRGRHRQARESPLPTHEIVITSRALPTTLSTNRSVYISCQPPKLIPAIYNASERSLHVY